MIERRAMLRAASHAMLGAAGLFGAAATAAVAARDTTAPSVAEAVPIGARARALELTFLKSIDADPQAAARFIRANWYAMDAIAVERGLMTGYELLVGADEAADWNLLMVVGYPDPRGYAAIATEFERIRAAHVVVPIDGRRLAELARIVGTRRLLRE